LSATASSPADRKTVLVTGTSTGIGAAAALAAARSGWHVVATMRDVAKADGLLEAAATAAVSELVDVRPLDVTDEASVARCIAGIAQDYGRLDAVVNNAGAGFVGTIEQMSTAQVRSTMEVNFFGVVEVTRTALPHLRAARGRVVTVTSVGGAVGQPFNEAYCAAKFAVEGFMESLAPVALSQGVRVVVVEPGAVSSEFVSNQSIDVSALLKQAGPYAPALEAYLSRARDAFAAAQTPQQAAQTILRALNEPEPAFRMQTSDAAAAFVAGKLSDLDGSAIQKLTTGWISTTG
jgi:NAD(P)-dependent dehydrogenase (short-subunit alcohol dehydrogenase family)